MKNLLILCLSIIAVTTSMVSAGVTWQPLHEPGSGGWITSFSVDPNNTNHALIGGDMLGIGWTDNRGEKWMPGLALTSYEICDFSWHPKQAGVVWAGSFAGPIKSTDGGKTWTVKRNGFVPVSASSFSEIIEKVLFDPNNADHLIAVGGNSREWNNDGAKAGLGAIYESTDGGENWKLLTRFTHGGKPSDVGANIMSAYFAPGSSTTIFACTNGGGVIVSNDCGKTWEERNEGLPHKKVFRIVIHPTDGKILWAALNRDKPKGADAITPGGVYKSIDGGLTWTSSSAGLFQHVSKEGNSTASYKALAISPSNPNVLATSDQSWNKGGVFISRDGGANWTLVATKMNVGEKQHEEAAHAFRLETAYPGGAAMTSVAFDPKDENVIYALGGEFGVRTTDGGKTWTDITSHRIDPNQPNAWTGNGYSGLCASDFVFNPTDPKRAMVIALDAGKVWESRDGLKSWTRHGEQPWPWGGAQAGTYSGEYGYVTAGQFGMWMGIVATRDGGKSWQTQIGAKHGLPENGKGGEPRGIFADPRDGQRVWASIGNKLYFTSDGGEKWTKLTTPEAAVWITGDPSKPGRVYLTGNRGAYVSDDGVMFTAIGGPKPATLGTITCDSLGRLYVCQWRNTMPGVWRYDGKQWERLLNEFGAKAVDIDPTDPNRVAMVTNDDPFHDNTSATGVWISADAGKTWSQANDGLGMLRGRCIKFNPTNPEQLVVGTWGGGYYTATWAKAFKPDGVRSYTTVEADRTHVAKSETASDVQTAGLITLRNGTFAAGTDTPEYWVKGWVGRGEIKVSRDTTTFKSGPASLCVEAVGDSIGQANQQVDCQPGERFTFSGYVKCSGEAKTNVAVQSFDNNWRPVDFQQAGFVANNTDWTEFKKDITIPKGANHCAFVLLVEGQGKAWLDDVKLSALAKDKSPAVNMDVDAKPVAGNLKNGDMSADNGKGAPRNWETKWVGKGKLAVSIDKETFKSEPSSLRVESEGDDAVQGQAAQMIDGAPGVKIGLSGFAKSAGEANVNVFIQPMDAKWHPIKFIQIAYLHNDTDWQAFKKEVELPEGTAHFGVGMLIEGKGKAWLDDVKMTVDGKEANAVADKPEQVYEPTKKQNPTVASPSRFPEYPKAWTNFHDGFNAKAKKDKADLIFFGDSITMGWGETGKTQWKEQIAPLGKAFNFGIGGDGVQQILWRIQNGNLEGQSPKVVVVAIGVNQFFGKGGTDEEIGKGMGMIVDEIKQRSPSSKILIVGIFPTQREAKHPLRTRVKNINALYEKLADGKQVHFLDFGDKLLTAEGQLTAEISPDAIHLTKKGYDVYIENLAPKIKQLVSDTTDSSGKQ